MEKLSGSIGVSTSLVKISATGEENLGGQSIAGPSERPGSSSTVARKIGSPSRCRDDQTAVMSLHAPDEPKLDALQRRYVSRSQTGPIRLRYLKIMGVNALRDDEPRRSLLIQSLAEDARQITDDELDLLFTSEWRSRLTAAWLIGLDRRTRFRDRIGSLLCDGALMKAGAGYAFALARFGQNSDAVLLAGAFERRLSTPELFYEQHFMIGALLYLDEQLGTDYARDILGRSWRQPVSDEQVRERFKSCMKQLCAFADECMLQERNKQE